MPLPFHMTLEYVVKGGDENIISKGACEMTGREDTVLCYNIKHRVYIPLSLHSGRAQGERIHTPLTVTKPYDKTSPLLYFLLVNQEKLKVTLDFYRINKLGNEENFFIIRLEKAIIVDIRNWMSTDFEKKTDVFTYMEDVSFSYKRIEWTFRAKDVDISQDDEWAIKKRIVGTIERIPAKE